MKTEGWVRLSCKKIGKSQIEILFSNLLTLKHLRKKMVYNILDNI